MKILYLAHRIPYPPNKGDKIRSFNEIKYLSKSHKIDLICLADDKDDLRYQKNLEKYCDRIFVLSFNTLYAKFKGLVNLLIGNSISSGYFYFEKAQHIFDQWLSENQYNAIICFSSPMAEYVFRSKFLWSEKAQGTRFKAQGKQEEGTDRPAPYALRPTPSLIMDFCDLDSDKWCQYAEQTKLPLNIVYRWEFKRLLKFEKRINQKFDRCIFVSDSEADLFYKLFPEAQNIHVIQNGVDTDYFSCDTISPKALALSPAPSSMSLSPLSYFPAHSALNLKPPVLLFSGAMNYHANVEGVTWFCDKVLPTIKKEYPEVQFFIVGSNPHPNVKALDTQNGVRVTGFVEDIRSYYDFADICVVPLKMARGVQNKILEAMAMGKPVVATSKAFDGIDAMAGKHLLVADMPDDFANYVISLIIDDVMREEIGLQARKLAETNFSWENNLSRFEKILKNPCLGE